MESRAERAGEFDRYTCRTKFGVSPCPSTKVRKLMDTEWAPSNGAKTDRQNEILMAESCDRLRGLRRPRHWLLATRHCFHAKIARQGRNCCSCQLLARFKGWRSEEHTSELQSPVH